MGLEVSRLARNSADWHRLLEICALSNTLILDEDGVYDPSHFNDRLLLGLKGTMSEAELHLLHARLIGGQLNKARRGALWIRPPIGYVFDLHTSSLILDPDEQIQGAVRLLFETFRRSGSALKVVRYFDTKGIGWPRRIVSGVRAGELIFAPLAHHDVLRILHNPRYTGAFVLRSHPLGEDSGRGPASISACSSARVESLSPQLLSRLHQLGPVRGQSGNLARQRAQLRIRPTAQPGA